MKPLHFPVLPSKQPHPKLFYVSRNFFISLETTANTCYTNVSLEILHDMLRLRGFCSLLQGMISLLCKGVCSMRFKKRFAAAVTAMLVLVLFTMPVSAHGHHGHHGGHHGHNDYSAPVEPDCPVCTVDGCIEYGRHTHDGHDYCGFDHKNGYCDGFCERTFTKDGCHWSDRNYRHHGW